MTELPDQLKMSFALWERVMVRQLILDKFGAVLALAAAKAYLRWWSIALQKTVEKTYQLKPEKVE